jgi:hypothetical protein
MIPGTIGVPGKWPSNIGSSRGTRKRQDIDRRPGSRARSLITGIHAGLGSGGTAGNSAAGSSSVMAFLLPIHARALAVRRLRDARHSVEA